MKQSITCSILIRSIVFNIVYSFTTLLFSLSAIVMMFGSAKFILTIAKLWSISTLFFLKHICKLNYEIEGFENIPKNTHVIFASKHQSAWETVAYQAFFHPTIFMFKWELMFLPFFGINLLRSGNIPVKRGSSTKKTLQKLTLLFEKRLKNFNIIIFPEGTRTKPGETDKYKSGLSLITKNIKTIVVPIAINSGIFWPKKSFIKYPGTIKMKILPSIKTGLIHHAEFQKLLISEIENAMKLL